MTRHASRVALLAVVALAAAVIATHTPARVAQPVDPILPELAADAPPERFAAWPPFVLAWTVEGSSGEAGSAADGAFGSDPCGPLGVPRCHVQLAWQDVSRWSLAAAIHPGFEAAPALQVSTGGLHYAVDRGVIVSVVDTDRLPGLHVCHRLAEARAAGAGVSPERAGGLAGDAWALSRAGLRAECAGPWGIPVAIATEHATWTPRSLSQRLPTPVEIGDALVSGRATLCPGSPCGDRGLDERVAAQVRLAGFAATVTPAGVAVDVPWAARGRRILAWASAAGDTLPAGMRRHRIGDNLVVDEARHPQPAVSAIVAGSRLWLAFVEPVAGGSTERDVFVLAEALRRIVSAAPTEGGSLPVAPVAGTR